VRVVADGDCAFSLALFISLSTQSELNKL